MDKEEFHWLCGLNAFCVRSPIFWFHGGRESSLERTLKKEMNITEQYSFLFHWIQKSLQKLDLEFLLASSNPTHKPLNQRVLSKSF
jgi:hypothetical protein